MAVVCLLVGVGLDLCSGAEDGGDDPDELNQGLSAVAAE
jgi:hypothetical protein